MTISDRRHALYGQRLELVSLEVTRGGEFITVRLPNGRQRSIRRNQTDLLTPLLEDTEPSLPTLRVDVRALLTLMHHLRSTLVVPTQEVIRDERASSNVSCSVPSSPTTVGSDDAAARLADVARGEPEATGQDCRNSALADAANWQTDKDDPSC